jgi:site-specific DNA-methyltransferase (adenine-specific)
MENKIIKGDALEILKTIADASVDHCITDPPYNISGYDHKKEIGWLKSNKHWTDTKNFNKIDEKWDRYSNGDYEQFTKDWLKEIFRIVKPNGNIILFGSYHNIYKLGNILQTNDRRLINSIVWYKRNAFPNITQRMLCESTEHLIWAVNNTQKHAKNWVFNYNELKKMNGGKQMRNMWDIPMTPASERRHGKHPSQKPIAVVERLLLACSNKNEIIIDPFVGSGTLPVVAKMHGRKYIGIDNNEEYLNICNKRIASVSQTEKLSKFM